MLLSFKGNHVHKNTVKEFIHHPGFGGQLAGSIQCMQNVPLSRNRNGTHITVNDTSQVPRQVYRDAQKVMIPFTEGICNRLWGGKNGLQAVLQRLVGEDGRSVSGGRTTELLPEYRSEILTAGKTTIISYSADVHLWMFDQ